MQIPHMKAAALNNVLDVVYKGDGVATFDPGGAGP